MNNSKHICIIGCGGHARSVADVILYQSPQAMLVFFDNNAQPNEKLWGFDVLKPEVSLLSEYTELFIATGDNQQRETLYHAYKNRNIISVVSSLSYISPTAVIGKGIFAGNFVHIGPEVLIGENTIINTGAIIEHEVKIGSHTHIAPNTAVSGRTVIGDHVFIGAGATIKNNISIVSNVTVGAGATVVKDITVPGTYTGCPAKRIK